LGGSAGNVQRSPLALDKNYGFVKQGTVNFLNTTFAFIKDIHSFKNIFDFTQVLYR
jgi:hypothetical protein